MERKRIVYYTAMIILVALTFFIYFWKFHGELSDDSYIWSNFGNYINGLLSPLLTIINIVVFIELTIAISQMEEQRSKQAIENEKQLLLMQLRKQEIDKFVQQMNRIYDGHTTKERIEALQQVIDYLTSFSEVGYKWFNINDLEHTKHKIGSLTCDLRSLLYDVQDNKDYSEELFTKIYNKTAEITNTLVEAALK